MADINSGSNTDGVVDHDVDATGVDPVLAGGYASAAAPTSVSADGDAVRAWHLRNGAQATVITAAGALIGGDATNGLDVDVTQVIPGVGATNLGKREDDPHNSLDVGVMALAVRNDSNNTIAGTNLDYSPLNVSASGMLKVFQLEGLTFDDVANSNNYLAVGGFDENLDPRALTLYTDDLTGAANARLATAPFSSHSRADTFTGAANGTTVGPLAHQPHRYFSLQVSQTGGVTVWDVRLEGSLDGVTYTTLLTHTNATTTGVTLFTTTPSCCIYYRSRCVTRTGGTSVTATILGMQ